MDQNGQYRGLIDICQELNLINENDEREDLLLPKLREKISSHIAFADENNINLITWSQYIMVPKVPL